jgi:hypothetical protein
MAGLMGDEELSKNSWSRIVKNLGLNHSVNPLGVDTHSFK